MHKAYFIGIGGIGMSALAQLMHDAGIEISGSDREASPVTELLESKGIKVAIGQKAENVPENADAIVYSDAVWSDNPERAEAARRGVKEYSYFQMLGKVSEGKKTVAVAGTHGKTTTTGMAAKILSDAGAAPTAVVGSLVKDFGGNYLKGSSDLFVVEADEYKAHLLELSPYVLVIGNLEWDHTDFYPTFEAMQETFKKAVEKVPADGAVVTNPADPNIAPILTSANARVIDYTKEPAYELSLPGDFNRNNARAAAAAARFVHPRITDDSIAASLASFRGTWRRFEHKGKTQQGADVYDDYAHHPTAVAATLAEARKKLPAGGRLFVAFHPHLYSRTRDLLAGFATAFKEADGVFIAPIYPAREVDDGSISSAMLAERIAENGTPAEALSFEEIQKTFETYPKEGDIVMTVGAGDIYKVADKLVAH